VTASIEIGSPSGSESLVSNDATVTVTGVFSFVEIESSPARGAESTGNTATVTDAFAVSAPSLIVYWNDAEPWKYAAGVNVTVEPVRETDPLTGAETDTTVNASPSTSESLASNADVGIESDAFSDAVA